MTQALKDQIIGATRLVRSGKLGEATALLQRTLRGESGAAGPAPSGTRTPALPPPSLSVDEPQPSSKQPGALWGAASFDLQSALEGLGFNPFAQTSPPAHAMDEATHGGSFLLKHFDSPAGGRPYKLYVPAVSEGTALPLVVMLHGCTQSPDDFAAGTRMNLLAEEQGFLVCYPAQTSSANSSKCWNWFNAADQHRDRGEPSIIAGITRTVMAQHAVDPVVPAVPTIVFHGDRDTTVNPVNGDEVAAQILKDGALRTEVDDGQVPNGHGYRRTRHLDRNGRTVVEQWTIHGAGHAWAGGSSAGSYTDPQGPDASREMMRFFAGHVGAAGG